MEYLLTYSNPEAAAQAGRYYNRMPESFQAQVEGSNVVLRAEDMRDAIWVGRGSQVRFRTIQPLLQLQYDSSFFGRLWPSGLFSDLTLQVQGRDFKVHRAILASVSDYFYALFTNMAGSIIELHDLDPNIFELVLGLIYGRKIPLEGTAALRVLILVSFFQLKGIDIDRYLLDIPPPPPEEFPKYLELLHMLYPAGLSKMADTHLEELLDYYENAPTTEVDWT